MAEAHAQPELLLDFMRQLTSREAFILLLALKQIGPDRRVDVLIMAKPTIQQRFPAAPPRFILGLQLAHPLRFEFKLKFGTQLVKRLASL